MKRLRSFLGDESGTAMIEFALVGGVFLIMVIGILDMARGHYMRNRLDYAADRLVRQVLMNPEASIDQLTMPQALGDLDAETLNLSLETVSIGGQQFRNLTITYPASIIAPISGFGSYTLEVDRLVYLPE